MAYFPALIRTIAILPSRHLVLDARPDWSIESYCAARGANQISSIEFVLAPEIVEHIRRRAFLSSFFQEAPTPRVGFATLMPDINRCTVQLDVPQVSIDQILQAVTVLGRNESRVCVHAEIGRFIADREFERIAPVEQLYALTVESR